MSTAPALLALALAAACSEPPVSAPTAQPAGSATPPPAAGAPAADPPDASRPAGHPRASWEGIVGEAVAIRGRVAYDGDTEGKTLRLDFLTLGPGEELPQLVHTTTLAAPGPFEVRAPANFGSVHLVAMLDVWGDGPTAGDPADAVELQVGDRDITGVELTLRPDRDLGPLTPNAAPEGAGGGPVEEAPRPAGAGGDPAEQPAPPAEGAVGDAGGAGASPSRDAGGGSAGEASPP